MKKGQTRVWFQRFFSSQKVTIPSAAVSRYTELRRERLPSCENVNYL